jgi:hypothetical protein
MAFSSQSVPERLADKAAKKALLTAGPARNVQSVYVRFIARSIRYDSSRIPGEIIHSH